MKIEPAQRCHLKWIEHSRIIKNMTSTSCLSPFFLISSSSSSSSSHLSLLPLPPSTPHKCKQRFSFPSANGKLATLSTKRFVTRAAEYKFPDPIPEFADAESDKFKSHLVDKLSKRDIFGESPEDVVGVCTEIFSTFLHSEYGGPGTLLVDPFADMADAVTEQGFPGGPQAARVAIKWAQNHVDEDWNKWTGGGDSN